MLIFFIFLVIIDIAILDKNRFFITNLIFLRKIHFLMKTNQKNQKIAKTLNSNR